LKGERIRPTGRNLLLLRKDKKKETNVFTLKLVSLMAVVGKQEEKGGVKSSGLVKRRGDGQIVKEKNSQDTSSNHQKGLRGVPTNFIEIGTCPTGKKNCKLDYERRK